MIPRHRITMSSLIVGLVGAAIGGFWGYSLWQDPEISGRLITFLAGLISGFLSCFFISIWYLRFMVDKNWWWGILFGTLFAGLAGATSGAITGMTTLTSTLLNGAYIGGIFGGCIGLAVGLLSSLIFGAVRAISTKARS